MSRYYCPLCRQHVEVDPVSIAVDAGGEATSRTASRLAALEAAAMEVKEAWASWDRCEGEFCEDGLEDEYPCPHFKAMESACASIAALVGEKETGGPDER